MTDNRTEIYDEPDSRETVSGSESEDDAIAEKKVPPARPRKVEHMKFVSENKSLSLCHVC